MDFRITGLDPTPFIPLYGLSDARLNELGILRKTVDAPDTVPDRIELRDVEQGKTALLLNHEYLDAPSPYRGRHAIFVREGAERAFDHVNQVPDSIRRRLMSLRAFNEHSMIIDADVVQGTALESLIERLFSHAEVSFIHAHHARYGCYAARIDRA